MAKEIERKYLVNHEEWGKAGKPEGDPYRQGYLLTDPDKTIRIRQSVQKGYLTIKGPMSGITRPEYEYEIPLADAGELLDQFPVKELSKVRYKTPFEGKLWDVDEYSGENEGLIIAEIELQSEDEKFSLPPWIDKEVTGDEKYYNSNLALHPFRSWKKAAKNKNPQ